MPTLGAQVVPSRASELRRLLQDISAADLGVLDAALGDWMNRPLGREALATVVLPSAGSAYLCLLSLEPAGLLVLARGKIAARVRALAVAPDLRRRGVARTLLEAADAVTAEAGLPWLWMNVPSANVPATACALACGFRRYRPQFLRRQRTGILSLSLGRTRVEPVPKAEAGLELATWIARAAEQGDAWCAPLAAGDLLSWNRPDDDAGAVYRIIDGEAEVGLVHVLGAAAHPRLTLWLDRRMWGGEGEMHAFKAALDTLADFPAEIDLEFGSSGHLRASVEAYRALGFKPVLRERVIMAKAI